MDSLLVMSAQYQSGRDMGVASWSQIGSAHIRRQRRRNVSKLSTDTPFILSVKYGVSWLAIARPAELKMVFTASNGAVEIQLGRCPIPGLGWARDEFISFLLLVVICRHPYQCLSILLFILDFA